MNFNNRGLNDIPCQTDLAADAWEEICAYEEAKRERIDEIVDNCINNDRDWHVIMPDIFETEKIESVVSDIITKKSTADDLFSKLTEIIEDIVKEDFGYYDRNISGESVK